MIREVKMYEAVCDLCGKWMNTQRDRSYIVNIVKYCGWQEINGKLYCPDCYEYNKETNEYKPKKKQRNDRTGID